MKDLYTLLTSNRNCCRSLFYLCNQAMINYDAELKNNKKIFKQYMIKESDASLAFGSLWRTVSGQW